MPTSGRNALANCIQRVEVVGGMLDTPDFEPQCFTDDSGTTFFGIWELNGDQITLNFYTVDAAGNLTPYVPTSQPVPCAPNDVETDNLCWLAIADGVGYSTGDQLTQWFFWDVTTDPPTLNGTAWFNNATGLTLAAAPLLPDLVTCDTSTIGWAVDLCDTIVQPPSVVVDSYPGVQGQTGNWQIMNGGFTVDYDVTAPSESADILTGSDGGIAVRNTGVPNDGPVVVTVPAAGIDTWSIDVFDLDLATLERVMFDVAPIAFTNALQIDPFTFEGVGDGLLSQFTFPGAVTVVTVTRPDLNAGEYVLEQVTINPPVVGTDIVSFQRCYEKDASGTVTVQDLDYDGNPYAVQGDVGLCEKPDCEILCDAVGGGGDLEQISIYPGANGIPAPYSNNGTGSLSVDYLAGGFTSGITAPDNVEGISVFLGGGAVVDLQVNNNIADWTLTFYGITPVDVITLSEAAIAVDNGTLNTPNELIGPNFNNDEFTSVTFPAAVTNVSLTLNGPGGSTFSIARVGLSGGDTTSIPFRRCYETDPPTDTDLDGNPYVVQGTPGVCTNSASEGGSCCDEDAVYQHKVFDLINGATWTPADLPAGIELIEFSFSVIINAADNGVINFDATPAGNLPVGYSVHGRVLEGGVITPPQIIDSGTAGRILVDATWRVI